MLAGKNCKCVSVWGLALQATLKTVVNTTIFHIYSCDLVQIAKLNCQHSHRSESDYMHVSVQLCLMSTFFSLRLISRDSRSALQSYISLITVATVSVGRV